MANTVNRPSAPPENRFKNPKMLPPATPSCSASATASTPGTGTKDPIRNTANRPRVYRIFRRSSGILSAFLSASSTQITSTVPPAATIFAAAALLKAWARTVSGRVSSPSPNTLMPSFTLRTTRFSNNSSGVTTVPGSNRFRASRLTMASSRRNGALLKPRLGSRRTSGVCPPSKAGPLAPPERAFCPLVPRPAVLPLPEPIPRPTRLESRRAPGAGRNSCSFISHFLHFNQVADLIHHPAHRRGVLFHHRVVEPAQPQRAQRIPLVLRVADGALLPCDLQLPGHGEPS